MIEFEPSDEPNNKITDICVNFKKESGISVSEHAQLLLKDIFNAIIVDSHPRWKVTKEEIITTVKSKLFPKLPEILSDIAKVESSENIITTFDILHWLSGRIDRLCPFPKEKKE